MSCLAICFGIPPHKQSTGSFLEANDVRQFRSGVVDLWHPLPSSDDKDRLLHNELRFVMSCTVQFFWNMVLHFKEYKHLCNKEYGELKTGLNFARVNFFTPFTTAHVAHVACTKVFPLKYVHTKISKVK